MKIDILKSVALLAISLVAAKSNAQTNAGGAGTGPDYTTITTAVPFMRISPDARSGGMGDVGIALSPDANAQYWNLSKLAMAEKEAGVSITYTPWLKDLVPDIFLAYISGYAKFGDGDDKNQAVSFGLRYFNLGSINYTNVDALPIGTGNPREFAFDIGYSRKLSENLAIGVAGKIIHSNIINGAANQNGSTYKPGTSAAVDLGMFYTKQLKANAETGQASSINAGLSLTNLGNKMSYGNGRKDFLPTNLGIGVAYNYNIDEFNKITFAIDANKLLAPSPHWVYVDSTEEYSFIDVDKINSKSVVSGILGSFSDASGGGSEELKEVMMSFGAEYAYQNQFFARAGYFYESKMKGDRRFLSLGVGVKYSMFGLNLAYVVPSGSAISRNPLSNTLRFSLVFDVDKLNTILLPNGKDSKKEDKKDAKKDVRTKK
jgi:hypothetical protein